MELQKENICQTTLPQGYGFNPERGSFPSEEDATKFKRECVLIDALFTALCDGTPTKFLERRLRKLSPYTPPTPTNTPPPSGVAIAA